MARSSFLPVSLAAAMTLAGALSSPSAMAAPFKCGKVGGEFVFGQEANVNSLDQMTSTTISTRNIAMNMFEALMTRDENNNPITELADSVTESPDGLTYTFKLRQGIKFHNGKPMTSADVAASWDRYNRVATLRNDIANVARWETPDANTFVMHMKTRQPTFIETISSFSQPIVIFPAEFKDDPAQQLHTVGTGPWQLVDFLPGSHREDEALRGLQAEHQVRAAHRLRRLQGGLLRHGECPHRDRAGRSRGGAEDRRVARRGGFADQVGGRPEKGSEHQYRAFGELVDSHHFGEQLAAADRQPEVPPGGPGIAGHGRDHGCGDGRQL